MANICDFGISITCPEDQANVIREAITSALQDHAGSAFGLILQATSLADYQPWDPHWTGIDSHIPYEDGALKIGGSCKWDAPVWLGAYVSLHYGVPVVMYATIEHEQSEERRINLHDPTDPDPLCLWERCVRGIQYPAL